MRPLYNEGPRVWQCVRYNEVSLYWGSFSLLLLLPRQRMLLVIPRTLHIEVSYIGATVIMCTVFFAHKCLKQDSYFTFIVWNRALNSSLFVWNRFMVKHPHSKLRGVPRTPPPHPPRPMSNLSILEVQLYRNIQENQEDLRKKTPLKSIGQKDYRP